MDDEVSSQQGSEESNNKLNQTQNWSFRSGIAVVALITTTITVENALHSALVPILPEHLYENSVGKSPRAEIKNQTITNRSLAFSVVDEIKCDEADESEISIAEENSQVATLFALKTLLQLIVSLLIGPVINKLGCSIPMVIGYVLMIAASITFAFGQSYTALLIGGLLQGADAACLMTAGMTLIAERFPDHKKRSSMIGVVLTGLGVGSLLGLPFGSVLHQTHGKMLPFLILSGLSVACAMWFFVTVGFEKRVIDTDTSSPSRWKLLQDPSILLVTFGVICCSISLPILEATLPLWMMRTLCFEEWRLGVAFVPACLMFILSTILFGSVSGYVDGMIWCVISCVVTSCACVWLPYSDKYVEAPMAVLGISNGMLDAGAFSAVANLIQSRFPDNCYGGGYALLEAAYCLSAVLGPLLSWILIPIVGFRGCMFLTVGITLVGSLPISVVCCQSFIRRRKDQNKNGEQFTLLQRSDMP